MRNRTSKMIIAGLASVFTAIVTILFVGATLSSYATQSPEGGSVDLSALTDNTDTERGAMTTGDTVDGVTRITINFDEKDTTIVAAIPGANGKTIYEKMHFVRPIDGTLALEMKPDTVIPFLACYSSDPKPMTYFEFEKTIGWARARELGMSIMAFIDSTDNTKVSYVDCTTGTTPTRIKKPTAGLVHVPIWLANDTIPQA